MKNFIPSFTLEEMIYLNASADNGIQKNKQEVLRNLKLTYAIGNDIIKGEVQQLINKIENTSDAEFETIVAHMPFDTGLSEDMLHEEIVDTSEDY